MLAQHVPRLPLEDPGQRRWAGFGSVATPLRDAAHQAIDRHRRATIGTSGFPRAPAAREEMETVGFEPTTPCLQSRCSPTELRPRGRGLPTAPSEPVNGSTLAPPHRISEEPNFAQQNLVGQGGLEPPTPRLSSVCSNQLSYWPRTCGVAQSGEGCAVGARRGSRHDQARRHGRYVCRQSGTPMREPPTSTSPIQDQPRQARARR